LVGKSKLLSFDPDSRDNMAPTLIHLFDPVTAEEIITVVSILKAGFQGIELRFKLIDVNEPIKEVKRM
jgi:hypothetical protein